MNLVCHLILVFSIIELSHFHYEGGKENIQLRSYGSFPFIENNILLLSQILLSYCSHCIKSFIEMQSILKILNCKTKLLLNSYFTNIWNNYTSYSTLRHLIFPVPKSTKNQGFPESASLQCRLALVKPQSRNGQLIVETISLCLVAAKTTEKSERKITHIRDRQRKETDADLIQCTSGFSSWRQLRDANQGID